jgi:Ca2+-transporting ATPase
MAGPIELSLLQGVSVLVLAPAVLWLALLTSHSETDARALTFVAGNLSLILTNRSWSSTIVQALRSLTPALGQWLARDRPSGPGPMRAVSSRASFGSGAWPPRPGATLAAGVLSVLWFEALNLLVRRRVSSCTDKDVRLRR